MKKVKEYVPFGCLVCALVLAMALVSGCGSRDKDSGQSQNGTTENQAGQNGNGDSGTTENGTKGESASGTTNEIGSDTDKESERDSSAGMDESEGITGTGGVGDGTYDTENGMKGTGGILDEVESLGESLMDGTSDSDSIRGTGGSTSGSR